MSEAQRSLAPAEVTLFDLWEAIGSLKADVRQSLEAKTDHEKRLRALEVSRNMIAGAIALVATGFGLLKGHA